MFVGAEKFVKATLHSSTEVICVIINIVIVVVVVVVL